MKHNLTLEDLSIEGWIAFSQAYNKAEEESFEKAKRIYSTLKQSKQVSERRIQTSTPAEIEASRTRGFIFYSDPPIEIADEDLDEFEWLKMLK